MAIRWAVQNGNWNSTSTWNDGATLGIPTSADDIWANNFVVNVNQNIDVISLNNTARAREIATPQMISNTSPSPVVISNIGNQSSAFQSFDRNRGSTNYSSLGQATGWTQVDFGVGNAPVINAYELVGADNVGNNIRSWELQGSNDGTNFTVLHIYTAATALAVGAVITFTSIGNTQGYRYYRLNVTANGGSSPARVGEIELYEVGTAALTSGGNFDFNTSAVTANITSLTTPLRIGATNIIRVIATGGTININFFANIVNPLGVASNVISHTGPVNFNLSGPEFRGASTGVANINCISKTSTSPITITGAIVGGGSGSCDGLNNSGTGNIIVVGNVTGGGSAGASGIESTAGNITVTGNLIGSTASAAIVITNGTLTVTGQVNGGSGGFGISMTNPTVTVIGNITAGAQQAINASSIANTLNVTGNVTASATMNAVAGSGIAVRLVGNMFNTSTYNAIYAPILFIDDTSTTQWRIFDSGGQEKSLYSADFTPNAPSQNKVRFGVTYGFGGSLTGTAIIPSPANVRKGVPTDNTVGTGELTAEDFLNAISASTNPIAIRLKNIATIQSTGDQVASYNI